MANEAQLLLLTDHIKLKLVERESATLQLIENSSLDAEISRSLSSLREGLQHAEESLPGPSVELVELRKQYNDLGSHFSRLTGKLVGDLSSTKSMIQPTPTNIGHSLLESERSSISENGRPEWPKSVRFQDSPASEDRQRSALLPYRDEEDAEPDQTSLSNEQIHVYHSAVMRDQDRQLDALGQSVGRQRELSIQIGNELDGQGELLDDIDEFATRHQTQLDRARNRLGRVARKAKDNLQVTTIIVLVIVLILLIVILK